MEKIYTIKEFYTRDVMKEVKLYTLDKKTGGARVIGSLSYRSGNASDVDLFEEVIRKDKKELIALFTRGIKRIVKELKGTKKQYFLEVKMGLNPLFKDIRIGSCANDSYLMDSNFFNLMVEFYKRKLITPKDMRLIVVVKQSSPKRQLDYEFIKNMMRKYAVLRWTTAEVLAGHKVLTDFNGKKYKYTIEEAVQAKSQINIEGLFITNDNVYSDCSNFFVLEYEDEGGVRHMLNLSDDALNDSYNYRLEGLKQSTYTLTYSKLQPNLFKALKRMLSIGKSFKHMDLIEKVYPIINSQLGQLYQMTSQLKTIMKVMKDHGSKYLYKDTIYNQLDKIRFKLQELIFVDTDFSDLFDVIDIAISKEKIITYEDLYDELEDITHNLLDYLNQQTLIKMKNLGLYPLPSYLIPKEKPF